MTASGSGSQSQFRRFSALTLRRTVEQVTDVWFPPNEQLLEKIRKGLQFGSYDNDIDRLVSDISGDLSLFAYCLRELGEMTKESGTDPQPASPLT